jgi:hypothetical protein
MNQAMCWPNIASDVIRGSYSLAPHSGPSRGHHRSVVSSIMRILQGKNGNGASGIVMDITARAVEWSHVLKRSSNRAMFYIAEYNA